MYSTTPSLRLSKVLNFNIANPDGLIKILFPNKLTNSVIPELCPNKIILSKLESILLLINFCNSITEKV